MKAVPNAFMKGDADSDDDDDGKRVVRSHKDKRWEQMTETITKMKNSMKNNDWNAVTEDFASLHKLLDKAKQIVAKEGVPTFYFKALLSLDASLQKALADKPAIKKMSKTNAKSLNGMKQNLKKKMTEHEAKLGEVKKAEAKGPKQIKDYNEAEIDDRCNLILSQRGRKGKTSVEDQISVLSQLADVTRSPCSPSW